MLFYRKPGLNNEASLRVVSRPGYGLNILDVRR